MLEQKDLDILKNMLETVMKGTEESILGKVDEKLGKTEESILEKVDEKLLKSEESILEKVDEKLGKTEESILEKVDEKLGKTEESILERADKKLLKSESLVLDEVERTRKILEKQIEKVQKNLDEINQYYKITKLENDNTSLVLKLIDELFKRIEELEKRTA